MLTVPECRIVVIGGGIIGCTSTYYITRHPLFTTSNTHITLLEASTIAAGASGKAAGLVANWAYPRELGELSFNEHKLLALRHDGAERWGWREVTCGKWEGRARSDAEGATGVGPGPRDGLHSQSLVEKKTQGGASTRRHTGLPGDLDWIDAGLTDTYEMIGGLRETAQVYPYEFTTSMLALAREGGGSKLDVVEGAKVISIDTEDASAGAGANVSTGPHDGGGSAERVRVQSKGDKVVGVTYITTAGSQSHTVHIPADTVLLAAGPWSSTVMPSLPVTATRAHSIVINLTAPLSAHVLFTTIHSPDSTDAGDAPSSPEIYARPQNRAYACGPGDDTPLPPLASLVQPSSAVTSALRAQVGSISTPLRDGKVEVEQACYMPHVEGGPIVGAVDTFPGLIVATGHTVWGICNAPGTAKAVAELMMEGTLGKEWKLSKLKPSKFLNK